MVQIIPAILTNDPRELEEKLARCEGFVDRVQIDIVDGRFVDNKTIDPSALEALETDLALDLHLMVKEPINWVERCVRAGADRIIAQVEQMKNQVEFVGKVSEVALSVGLAVDIETPVSALDPVVLTNLDVVLVMGVEAGWGGRAFDKRALNKVKELNETRARDDTPFKICLDGGQTLLTIDDVRFQGADEVAIGKKIFEGDIGENIDSFIKAAHK